MAKAKDLFTSHKHVKSVSPAYEKADKANREGFPAFSRSLEEQTLSVLTSQTLGNTFYCSAQELAQEMIDVISKMGDKDPAFLGKALVYARNNGMMKLAPTVGLAVLSTKGNGEKKDVFRQVFHHVVKLPDDLREFVLLCRGKIRKGLGGEARDAVKRWLQHMSEYHAVKYGSGASKDITIRDILRMAHPRPVNEGQRELFGWLVKGWNEVGAKPSPSNPQVWAFEKIKRSEDEKEIVSLITEYRLPWEVVVPSVKKMTVAIWKALLKGMPYMALLRNLNTMERHGVFKDAELVKEIAKKISDKTAVAKSKQLPFRFWNAFNAFNGDSKIKDALADALEESFVNVPEIEGEVCIANDVSWSMSSPVSDKSKAQCKDIAGIMAASLFKKCPDSMIVPFDSSPRPDLAKRVTRRDSIMGIAQTISVAGGGTDVGASIRYLAQKRKKVDVFIGLTDCEDWAGHGFLTAWEDYKKNVNPEAKAFLVTLAPYRDFVAPDEYPDVFFVHGWSPQVLSYIATTLKAGSGQVDEVRKIDLSKLNKPKEKVKVSK